MNVVEWSLLQPGQRADYFGRAFELPPKYWLVVGRDDLGPYASREAALRAAPNSIATPRYSVPSIDEAVHIANENGIKLRVLFDGVTHVDAAWHSDPIHKGASAAHDDAATAICLALVRFKGVPGVEEFK